MQAYRTEGNYRSAARLSPAELRAAMANREILQATALAFDTQRQLRASSIRITGTKSRSSACASCAKSPMVSSFQKRISS